MVRRLKGGEMIPAKQNDMPGSASPEPVHTWFSLESIADNAC